MVKRKILAEVMAVCMICGMTACEKNDIPEAQAAQESSTTEILMPDGWTKEDFFNFFVINGKTLTMPATLNELMEFDDKFTYEVVAYVDDHVPWGYNYSHKKGFAVSIIYNNKYICDTLIYSEENDEKAMLDFPMCVFIFDKDLCQEAGIEIDTACGLDYNSTYDDVEKIFGVPTADPVIPNRVDYKFNDDEDLYTLFFYFNEESNKIETFHVGIYSFDEWTKQFYR